MFQSGNENREGIAIQVSYANLGQTGSVKKQ